MEWDVFITVVLEDLYNVSLYFVNVLFKLFDLSVELDVF